MKGVLVVIDFQNDFISGALGFENAERLRDPIRQRIQKALSDGDDLVFTLDTHSEETYATSMEGKKLPAAHCIKGTVGWLPDKSVSEFVSKAKVFEKSTFGSLELASYLKEKGYDRIELCGLVCSICVLSNAILAKSACPDAEIIVDSRLTEDSDAGIKERTLACLENVHITVSGRK